MFKFPNRECFAIFIIKMTKFHAWLSCHVFSRSLQFARHWSYVAPIWLNPTALDSLGSWTPIFSGLWITLELTWELGILTLRAKHAQRQNLGIYKVRRKSGGVLWIIVVPENVTRLHTYSGYIHGMLRSEGINSHVDHEALLSWVE